MNYVKKMRQIKQALIHIVPHFLLKRIHNVDGKTGRDNELAFNISKYGIKSYFGRSVLPEKLDEVYGNITDHDISNNKNIQVIDNIFCNKCEEGLASLENEYSHTIDKVENIDYHSGVDGDKGILFWGSVLWRMSIGKRSGVFFSESQNEKLRKVLNDFLNKDAVNTKRLLSDISYKIIRFHNCTSQDIKILFIHPKFRDLFCLLVDEFIIVMSLENDFSELNKIDFYDLNDKIIYAPTIMVDNKEIIKPLDRLELERLRYAISLDVGKDLLKTHTSILNDLYLDLKSKHGIIVTDEQKKNIWDKIILGESKLGRKFNLKEISKIVYDIIV